MLVDTDKVRRVLTLFWKFFMTDGGGSSFIGGRDGIGSHLAYDQAVAKHLIVILPEKNQLFVDIDNELQYAIYERNLLRLQEFYEVTGTAESPSKSGTEGRCHITISLAEDIEDKERLLLQAFLGSDLTREFLGLQRIKAQDPAPTLFLEKLPDDYKDEKLPNDIPF